MVKRTPADNWFSKCIRIRSNWTCEYCNVSFEHNKSQLHCSHFISRGYLATRYHPKNALAHCQQCHEKLGGGRWGGGNVAEFAEHYDSVFSSTDREIMRQLAQAQFRKHKQHLSYISKHYRTEHKAMEAARAEGCQDRLEFPLYNGVLELIGYEEQLRKELNVD